MKTNAQIAARELFESIHAPLGLVNTSVSIKARSQCITVLVDASYKNKLDKLPKTFHGYPVILEVRQPAIAY